MKKKIKKKESFSPSEKYVDGKTLSDEELKKLKEEYRSGNLKFNSRDIAKEIVNDLKRK